MEPQAEEAGRGPPESRSCKEYSVVSVTEMEHGAFRLRYVSRGGR